MVLWARYGSAGLILGVAGITIGQVLTAFAGGPIARSLGDPLIAIGTVLAISLGIVGRKSRSGKASFLFGGAMAAFILLAVLLD